MKGAKKKGKEKHTQIQPDIKGRIRHLLHLKPHLPQPPHHQIPLPDKMPLQRLHLRPHLPRLQHPHRRLLKRHVRAPIQIAPARPDRLDEFLGPHHPRHPPPGETEALGEAVDDEDVVGVDVVDVVGGADDAAVAGGSVVVAAVEFVHDEGGAVAADVLDLREFRVGDDLAGGVARVGGQDYGDAAGDFFGDFVGVDGVAVGWAGGRGD